MLPLTNMLNYIHSIDYKYNNTSDKNISGSESNNSLDFKFYL